MVRKEQIQEIKRLSYVYDEDKKATVELYAAASNNEIVMTQKSIKTKSKDKVKGKTESKGKTKSAAKKNIDSKKNHKEETQEEVTQVSYFSRACRIDSLTNAGNDFHDSLTSSFSYRSWSAFGTLTMVSVIMPFNLLIAS